MLGHSFGDIISMTDASDSSLSPSTSQASPIETPSVEISSIDTPASDISFIGAHDLAIPCSETPSTDTSHLDPSLARQSEVLNDNQGKKSLIVKLPVTLSPTALPPAATTPKKISNMSLSPLKRKASSEIQSPSKRLVWSNAVELDKSASLPLSGGFFPGRTHSQSPLPSSTKDLGDLQAILQNEIDNSTSINSVLSGTTQNISHMRTVDQLFLSTELTDHLADVVTPDSATGTLAVQVEKWIPAVTVGKTKADQKATEMDGNFNAVVTGPLMSHDKKVQFVNNTLIDTTEYQYSRTAFVTLQITYTVRKNDAMPYAIAIRVSASHNGAEIASSSGLLIARELIREKFYDSMGKLWRPTSEKIFELLDHHGYIRWTIKNYHIEKGLAYWDPDWDNGAMLEIDSVHIHKDWRNQAMGDLMVKSLIERAKRMNISVQLAYVKPAEANLWHIEHGAIWGETHHHWFFMQIGFTRILGAEGWYVLSINGADKDKITLSMNDLTQKVPPMEMGRMAALGDIPSTT